MIGMQFTAVALSQPPNWIVTEPLHVDVHTHWLVVLVDLCPTSRTTGRSESRNTVADLEDARNLEEIAPLVETGQD